MAIPWKVVGWLGWLNFPRSEIRLYISFWCLLFGFFQFFSYLTWWIICFGLEDEQRSHLAPSRTIQNQEISWFYLQLYSSWSNSTWACFGFIIINGIVSILAFITRFLSNYLEKLFLVFLFFIDVLLPCESSELLIYIKMSTWQLLVIAFIDINIWW